MPYVMMRFLGGRVARPARAGVTRETETKAEAREEGRTLSGDGGGGPPPHALSARPQAPPSPGRALLESIAARDASELSQLRETLVAETERADEAGAFAAGVSDRTYAYTETLAASVADLKLSLAAALEDRDAARASHTPALAKLTAKYASVRDSLGVMSNRADHLMTELLAEQLARRRDHAGALLRCFADLVICSTYACDGSKLISSLARGITGTT